ELARRGRELELAVAHEVALDLLVADHPLDRVDRVVVRAVPVTGTLGADTRRDLRIVDREAVVHMTTIAARSLRGHALTGLEPTDLSAAPRQRGRRRQAGEPTADDDDIGRGAELTRTRHERRGGVGPVGVELHGG